MIETLIAVIALILVYCWRSAGGSPVNACAAAASQSHRTSHGPVPEDAVLRRHFITHVSCEIEAGLSPRPTDSVLIRHHEALLAAKLEQRLAELGRLRAC